MRASDLASAGLRIAVGAVLIWGALTKLVGGDRISELAALWSSNGVPHSELMVAISIGLQLALALLLLLGFFTRAAGLLNSVNFAVAAAISGIFASGANWWPFALLILLLLYFGVLGAGRLSVDGVRARRLSAGSLENLLTSMGVKPHSGAGNYPGQGS